MSASSSNAAGWSSLVEEVSPPSLPVRADDPRLGQITTFWSGDPLPLLPGQPVLIGFPEDEGIRRNGGRPGASLAPGEIRHWLYRLTPVHPAENAGLADFHLVDLGNLRISANLEQNQWALGEVVAHVLSCRAVPIVLGGGHETAYGTYLGHVRAGLAQP